MRRLLVPSVALAATLAALLSATPIAAASPAAPAPSAASWVTAPDGSRLEPAAHGGIYGANHRSVDPATVSGTTHWVILRCAYQHQWGTKPQVKKDVTESSDYFDTMFSAATPGLANFWHSTSYGKITVTHTTPGAAGLAGWRDMPQDNSAYGHLDGSGNIVIDASFDTLASDCASVWDNSITFSANTYYAFTLDQTPGACGVGGSFGMSSPYPDGLQYATGTLIGSCQGDEALWSHEMGHAYGLQHSEGPDGGLYNTSYDIMSAPSGDCPPAGSNWLNQGDDARTKRSIGFGCIPGQPLAYHKARVLGWIPANRQFKSLGGSKTITLERLAKPTTNAGYLYAELPTTNGYYTVEARIKTGISPGLVTGYDENFTPKQAYSAGDPVGGNACIVINKIIGTPQTGIHIRLQGTGSGFFGDAGQCWTKGETWSDGHGASVKVNSNTLHSFNVTVTSRKQRGFAFHPASRARILDTETSTGGHHAKLGAGQTMSLHVLGVGGVPASGVGAVVLNLHALNPSANSVITAWPAGVTRPATANMRTAKNHPDDALITIKPGANGNISIYNRSGSTDLTAEVIGYYGSLANGLGYDTVYPTQVYPSDGSGGYIFEMITTIAPHTAKLFMVSGFGGIPASGVSAVALQIEEEQSSAAGRLTAYPAGTARPSTPDMAYAANSVVVRNAIVKLGGGGRVALYNGGSSNAYVRVEATGFFSPTAPLSFRPVTPQHLKTVSLADGMPKNVDLTGSAGIPASGAKVVLGTLSAIAPSGGGYLTVRPSDESHLYGGYDLGWIHDDTNQVFAQVPAAGTAALTMSSFGSNKQVGIDVFGWFGPR